VAGRRGSGGAAGAKGDLASPADDREPCIASASAPPRGDDHLAAATTQSPRVARPVARANRRRRGSRARRAAGRRADL